MGKPVHQSVRTISTISSALLLFIVTLLVAVFTNPSTHAVDGNTTTEDTVTAVIEAACTLSGTGADSHTASLNPGIWTPDIGISHMTAICNDPDGYAIYAVGFSNDSYDTSVNTKLYNTIGADTYTISTADYTASPSDSFWSMKLAQGTGDQATIISPYNDYSAVPSTYTKVATYPAVTAGTSGSSFTSTYGVYPSFTQAAGTYTGKVKYTLVHPNNAPAPTAPLPETACTANQICYAPNTSDINGSMSSLGAVTSSPIAGKQTGVATSGTAELKAPNFQRSGYGFAGWSTDFKATSSSTIYGPNQTITTATDGTGDVDVSTKGLILYPVWVASAGSMQSDASSVCSSLTAASYNSTTGALTASLSSVSALTDQRDGNTYAIAKLADNNCWMIENLRINAEDTIGDAKKALAQGYGDDTANNRGKFIGLADSEDVNFFDSGSSATASTPANSLYYAGTQSGTATMNIGQIDYAGFRMPRYNKNNTNLAANATNSAGTTLIDSYNASTNYARWYGYGNYYTWSAAMANTGHYNTTTVDVNGYTPSEAANTSLCPNGWQLPYGRSTGKGATTKGFSYLDTQMGGSGANASSATTPTGADRSKMWRHFPNNFVYSGYFYTASALSRGRIGYYWSSSVISSNSSYFLSLGSSALTPGSNSGDKSNGLSIRCLASS